MKDQEAFNRLQAGDASVLAIVYQQNRQKCLRWALKNCSHLSATCTMDDAVDLFQDAIVILHQNVVSGRLSELRVKISTYLIAIMRNIWRSKAKQATLPLEEAESIPDSPSENTPNIQVEVHMVLGQMEGACKEMLTLRYFMQFDFEDIAEVLAYKNGSTVRNLISRCRSKFRQIYTNTILQS